MPQDTTGGKHLPKKARSTPADKFSLSSTTAHNTVEKREANHQGHSRDNQEVKGMVPRVGSRERRESGQKRRAGISRVASRGDAAGKGSGWTGVSASAGSREKTQPGCPWGLPGQGHAPSCLATQADKGSKVEVGSDHSEVQKQLIPRLWKLRIQGPCTAGLCQAGI